MKARNLGKLGVEAAFVLVDLTNLNIDFYGPALGVECNKRQPVKMGLPPTFSVRENLK